MIKRVIDFILVNKLITFLSIALFSFVVATIALAVEKSDVVSDLSYCNDENKRLLALINAESTVAQSSTMPTTLLPTTLTEPTTLGTTASTTETSVIIDYRLPDNVKPFEYDLLLNPTLGVNGSYTGIVIIGLNITATTNEIILHSKGLTIANITMINRDTSADVPLTFTFQPETEFLRISVVNLVPSTSNYVTIHFEGSLTDKLVGFYQSKYKNLNNEERYIATSKFEPTFARQAFPCFDEPSMKAKFTIKIVRPTDDYIALSNMNELSSDINEDTSLTTVTFAESVPMSTYLACFIVCDFKYKTKEINAVVGNNFEMRVYATPDQLNKVDFALETGAAITEYYIDYFQVDYPLPKLDMIAIPDFVSGAMEHWGLVTFRETALLFDETISSTINKQRVASVVAHELAHMWFGNLVTMAWWNDLWLNEGFASYIEFKGVDKVCGPTWGMMDQFIIDDLHSVLNLDATLASHPIVQTVEHPDDITELFDAITYNKGAAVIRMLEDMIGAETFNLAVTNYLKAHMYGNAVTSDLLSEIDNLVTDIDIKRIMATWTEQMGLPIITVRRSGMTYILEQKRFFSNPKSYDAEHTPSEFNYRWTMKITYFTNTNTEVKHVWHSYEDTTSQIETDSHTWIKLNKDQIGYYRVNYPRDIWDSFVTALSADINVMSVSDRANLLNDAFSLAESTEIAYSIPLNLTKYLSNEVSYVPWAVASSKLSGINNLLYFTDIYTTFKAHMGNLIKPVYDKVLWEPANPEETHLTKRLRITILELACTMGIKECLDEASTRFNTWITSENTTVRPHPDIRSIVYYYGMAQNRNEQLWDEMLKIFVAEQDASEKLKLMYGLSAIQIPYILSKFVVLANDSAYVREQDYFTCLQYIAGNRYGENIVWLYVREFWPNLVEKFGLNERYLGRMIPSITSKFSTKTRLNEMKSFFEEYPEAGAGKAARVQAIENVEYNIEWLKNNKELVENWLDDNKIN